MSSLGYEERKRIVGEWLVGFLKRYEVPSSFDKLRAQDEMVFMVEDINSEIPNGMNKDSMNLLLERVAAYVRKNNSTRTWPTIKMMLKGVEENAERIRSASQPMSYGERPNLLDPVEINAKRVRAGEPVGEYWVFGKGAHLLLDKKLVSQSDLDRYLPPRVDHREPRDSLTVDEEF